MPKPSSGRLISIGFLLASCTVILRSLPARMAAMSLSVSVMATKHPTLVQVWIDCRSAVPLSTLTKTGSVRLRPSGSVIIIAALLPSAAGRTRADTTNCRVSRWKTCWTARQSSVLPSPAHSTRHAVGAPSGACCARAASGHVTAAPPSSVMNSRRFIIRLPRLRARAALRNFKADRAGGRQIDDEIELGRLYHRQIGRLLAFQDAAGIDTNLAIGFGDAGPVAHQAAGFGVPAQVIDRG